MVIAERQHYPGIGEIYRQIVPRIQAWMRRMFREQTGASFCRDEAASDFLADMFLAIVLADTQMRSEEHTSELQSLMRISYAVFCLKNKQTTTPHNTTNLQRTREET